MEGKPSRTCQTRFGAQMSNAIAAATHGYFVRNSVRNEGVRRMATVMPMMRPTMGVLDLQPYAERDAQIHPVAGPTVGHQTQKPVEGDHPRDVVEGDGLEDPVRAEEVWR